MKNQNMVPDFFCVFWFKTSFIYKNKSMQNIQTPAFVKISTGKILHHKCEEPKKLICNTMSFFSWANYNVKNVLLFFNSKLKTSCIKWSTGSCPFQCCLLMLIHVGGFYTGAIFNSIARKIFPKEINSSPLRKSLLKKVILKKEGRHLSVGRGDLLHMQVVWGESTPSPCQAPQ